MIQYNIKKKALRTATWCWATLPRKIVSCLVIAGILLSSAWFLFFKPAPVEAGWFDEDWLYRRSVTVTNNTTAETDVYVEITSIDTSDAGKVQADCGDLRFTKLDGTILDYYIVSGCRTSSTTIHVKLDMLQAGAQTIYFYYGNSSAVNGFIGTDFSTVASNYSVGSIGSEEKGTGPVLWLKFDEGYGAFAYNSTENDAGKLPGTQLDTSHPLANGLVGYWLLNEGSGNIVSDLSGNGKTGIITGADWISGKFGSALYLDGTNSDKFRVTTDISGWTELTISLWWLSDDLASNQAIATHYSLNFGGGDTQMVWRWDGSRIDVYVYGTGGLDSLLNVVSGISQSTLYHLAFTWNGSGLQKFYVNGIEKRSEVATGGAIKYHDGNPGIDFGFYIAATQLQGKLDVPIIYNRALSADEIAQLYREPFVMVSDTGASRISGASWTSSGKFDKALDFDGTDDVVTVIRGDTNVGLQNKSAYSISAWIYPHSDGENNVGEIIDKGVNTYIRVDSEGSDGYLDLEAKLDLASSDPTLNIANAVRINRWSHILLVWEDDDDDEFTIYVNGIDMGTSSGGSGAPADDSGNDLLIGGDTSANFDGIIDEVIIYPYARSAVQVKRSYNKGAAARIGRDDSWLTDGLVGYWKMDESSDNAADSSGAGTTLTNTGTATFASGKFANGTSLDGSTQYFYAADNATLSLTGDVVLSAWVYADTVSGTDVIVGKWDESDETYLLSLESGKLRMYIDSSSNYQTTDTATVSISTWTLVTGVYDASAGKVRLYIDGREENSSTTGTIPTSIGDDGGRFYIGAEDSTGTAANFFDGKIDDIRVYSRELSGFEVRRLYDWGPPPIAEWKFDEGSGATAYDTSENSNDGTLNGPPTWKSAADCKYGSCLDFDGDGDYVDLPITSDFTDIFRGNTNFTIALWAYPRSFAPGSAGSRDSIYIIEGSDTSNRIRIYWYSHWGTDEFEFQVTDDWTDSVFLKTGDTTNSPAWMHVTVTWDGTDATLFIDGVNKDSDALTQSGFPDLDPTNIKIGRSGSSFDGLIDEVKIYNYALTQKQIVELMMGGRPAITETTSSPGAMAGYWKFDEGYGTTAFDASGRSNNLTHSAEAYTMAGKFGRAWDGDGAKYLSIADDPDFDFTATEDFSISGWFKHSPISTSNDYIIAKYESGGGYKIYMDSDGDIVFAIDDDGTWGPEDVIGDDQGRNYDDNAWHYFTAVKQGTSSIRLYVDGREIDNDTSLAASGTLVNTNLLYVGIDSDAATGPFDGELDEIKIYRFALSPEEILLDYNKGKAVIMGAVGTESDGTTPSWSQDRAYCPPGFTGTCDPPVGEYKFDEFSGSTANDTGGNTNNGVITGAAWKGPGDCKYDSCLDFDGTDDVVTVTQDSSINMSGKSGYTMSAWVYPNSDGENDVGEIIDKGTNTYLRLNTESDGLDVEAKLDLATTDATLNIDDIIFTNNWYHIVMTYEDDGDDEITIYIDGINKGSSTDGVGSLAASDSNDLLIGGDTSANFDGLIDDVKIFDYALSQEQVAWIYNKGKPVGQWKFDEAEGPITYNSAINDAGKLPGLRLDTDHSLSTGLVGLWLMNENTGTTIADLSGNRNTGVFVGGTLWYPGKFGPCLHFDGSDDYVNIPHSPSIDIGTGDITIIAWFKYSTRVPGARIFNKGGVKRYEIHYNSPAADDVFTFVVDDNTTKTDAEFATDNLNDNRWHVVVAQRNYGVQTRIKVDDGAWATNADSTGDISNTVDAQIGTNEYYSTGNWNGEIDNVMVWARLLSDSEIAQLYREPFAMISDTGASSITGAAWNSSGKYNSALDFDGIDDVVTVVANEDIDLNNKTGYSICAWINPDTDGEGNAGEWFSKGSSYIRVDTESGATVKVSARFDLATDATLSTSKTIPTGSWSHICTTWKDDSDDELTIYINGLNAGSSTDGSGAPVDDSTSQLYIGGDSSNNFDGDIDEVTIYNYELTAEQVKIDYNQGAALRFGD